MDSYDYLDSIEEPDEDELRELEEILNPEKLKLEYADNITEDIDNTDREPMLEFSRSENGYKLVAVDKETSISLSDLIENKAVVSHLQNQGVFTVNDILRRTRREISSYEFIGAKEADAIGEKLYYLDLTFADERIYKCERCNAKFLGYKVKNENILCPVCHMLEKNEKCTYYIKTFLPNDYKKGFKEILLHIDSYVYDFENEEIMIRGSLDAIPAIIAYQQVLETHSIGMDSNNLKWCFDIAIDYVRTERVSLDNNCTIMLLNYFLDVYNKYVKCAKKHTCNDEEKLCSMVAKLIYTICHPHYNCFNQELTKLLNNDNYIAIKASYKEKFPLVDDCVKLLAQEECNLTAENMLNSITKHIRHELGSEGFRHIVTETSKKKLKEVFRSGSWMPFIEYLGQKSTGIFVKEYNQLRAILQLEEFSEFINDTECDEKAEECYADKIVESLGLSEIDTQCMAECLGSICNIKNRLYRSCVFNKRSDVK